MFVPSFKKFKLDSDTNHYVRRFMFEDNTYDIHIPKDQWTNANRKKIKRFLNKDNILSVASPCNSFITVVENDCTNNNQCEYCQKNFSLFSSKVRHQQTCKLKGVTNIRTYNDNSNNQTINNITNNDNSVTNNHIHIHCNSINDIRDFGEEDTKWLTGDVLQQLILPKMEAIQRMIASKHFNDKFPQNQNVRLNSAGNIENSVHIRKNGKWMVALTDEILSTLYNNLNEVILTALTGDFLEDFDEYEKEAFTEFHNSELYTKFKQLLKDKWEDMTSTFINDTIRKNMLKILEVLVCNKDLIDTKYIEG